MLIGSLDFTPLENTVNELSGHIITFFSSGTLIVKTVVRDLPNALMAVVQVAISF